MYEKWGFPSVIYLLSALLGAPLHSEINAGVLPWILFWQASLCLRWNCQKDEDSTRFIIKVKVGDGVIQEYNIFRGDFMLCFGHPININDEIQDCISISIYTSCQWVFFYIILYLMKKTLYMRLSHCGKQLHHNMLNVVCDTDNVTDVSLGERMS